MKNKAQIGIKYFQKSYIKMLLKYAKKSNNLLTMKTQTNQLKMYKDFNRLYTEEDILMANTHIKICSTFCHIYHI